MIIFPLIILFSTVNCIICKDTEVPFFLKITYSSNSDYDSIQLWKNTAPSGILLYHRLGKGYSSQTIEDTFCIQRGYYDLVLSSLNNNGWSVGTKVQVLAESGIVLEETLLDSFNQRLIHLDYNWLITPMTSWKVYDSYQEGWNTNGFDDSQWEEASAGFFSPISSSTYTRYYRTVLSIPSLPSFAGIRAVTELKYGMVLYANAVELGRYNMLNGPVQPFTVPSIIEETVTSRSIFSNQVELFHDSVVVAVEVHMNSHAQFEDFFSMHFFFLPTEEEGWYRLSETAVSTNDFSIVSGMDHWVDHDIRTAQMVNRNYYLQLSFHNLAKVPLNAYSITLINPEASPLIGWRIDGSQNGALWETVDSREGFFFLNQPTAVFDIPSFTGAYVYYRFYFLLSSSTVFAISLAEIQFLIRPTAVPTSISFSYPFASYTFFPGQTGINIQPFMDGFKSASILVPILPGLTFSSISGSFYGSIPLSAEYQSVQYAVVATHRTGVTYTAQLQLNIGSCTVSHHPIQFTMTSRGKASSASWDLQQNGITVLKGSGTDTSTPITTTWSICIQEGVYELHLRSLKQGWPAGSSLHMVIPLQEDSVEVGDVTLPTGVSSLIIPLHLQLISDGSVTNWFYFPESTIPSDWTSETVTSSWSSLPATLSRSGSVCLFRKSFSIQSIQDIVSVEFRFFCSPGLVVYINGQLVMTRNVYSSEITPTSTSTKSGGSIWHIYSLSRGESMIRAGSNQLAVAVVHATSAERVVDFKTVILLHAENEFITPLNARDFLHNSVSYSANMHVTNHEVIHLFDSNLESYYSAAWSSNQPIVTITFSESRSEAYNRYCLTSSAVTGTRHDPFSWTLESSIDGNLWNPLHQITSTRFERGERKCSIFSTVRSQYFRLRFLNTRELNPGTLNLAELAFLFEGSYSLDIPLDYSQTSFTAFQHIFFSPSYSVNNVDYTYFTITPSLPAGLFIDSISGMLFGTPTTLSDLTEYTITAFSYSSVSTTVVITLQVVSCEGYDLTYSVLSVQLDDYYTSEEPFNTIQMYIHSEEHTILSERIIDTTSLTHDTASHSFAKQYCLPSGMFTVQFGYAIQTNTLPSYSITLGEKELYVGTLDPSIALQEFIVSNQKLIHPVHTSWNYCLNATEISTNWYQSTLSEAWPEATPSHFETPSSITSYYCTSFYASYSTQMSSFIVGVFTRGGFAVYLNGVEINRIRLPAGDLTTSTLPISEASEPSYILYSGSVQFSSFSVQEDSTGKPNNRLCIEVHQSLQSQPNIFTCYMEYIQNQSDRILDGEPWGSINGISDPWQEYIVNAFDKNPSTKYFGESDCQNIIARWNYHNFRREYVNALRFYAGNLNARRPKSLRVEGSNDLQTWTKLLDVSDLEWENKSGYGFFKDWTFSNVHSFASYQVVGNGCSSQGIEFAEVILSSVRVDATCEAVDGFPAANEGQESHGPCPEYHIGYAIRICQNGEFTETDFSQCVPTAPTSFTYTPSSLTVYTHAYLIMVPEIPFYTTGIYIKPGLPQGVHLNATTGVIAGTPFEATTETSFTVTAMNARGKTTTTITLIVRSGCPAIGDFPSTPVGVKERYRCSQNGWMYGTVTRECRVVEGVPMWSEPEGYCKNTAILLILIVLLSIIVFAVGITWCISESLNRNMNVYELPNGEIELEEIGANGVEEELEESEYVTDKPARRRKKLIGRPVFIYIPRYFKRTRRDYRSEYKQIRRSNARVIRI